jgi:DNA-binding transcriptional ArsR family regulator
MAKRIVLMVEWRKAVCSSALDSTAKLVAHTFGAHMNANGLAKTSRGKIAKEAGGLDVRTVERATKRIEEAGLMRIERSRGRHVNRSYAIIPTAAGVPLFNGGAGAAVEESNGGAGVHPTAAGVPPESGKEKAASMHACDEDSDFTALVAPLKLQPSGTETALAWWTKSPTHVKACAKKARTKAGVENQAGFFLHCLVTDPEPGAPTSKRPPLDVALCWARAAGRQLPEEDLLAVMPFADKLSEDERKQVLAEVKRQTKEVSA